jgi:hypothetical protein
MKWGWWKFVVGSSWRKAGRFAYFVTDYRADMISQEKRLDRTILFVLIVLEALLFYSFYTREVAWYPPDNFDQASYLLETYRLQEHIFAHDLGQVWKAFSSGGHAAGVLFPIEGALAGIIIGGARLPQLTVLFISFCALQIAAFATARTIWKDRVYGYIALGLILSQITLWFPEGGGVFDFRMDFLAYCFYGVWVCAVLRSDLFLDPFWSIASGLIGAFLVLNRFVTVVYLLGVLVGFALVCGIILLGWRRQADLISHMRRRLRHLGLSAGVLLILVAPLLIRNWSAIHAYYVMGHAFGEEKEIRAAVLGIKDLRGHLSFYPRSIFEDHLGKTFVWGSGIVIVCALAARFLSLFGNKTEKPKRRFDETILLQILFLLGAILCPVSALTADISKSAVVGGVVGGPVAMQVVAVIAAVAPDPGVPVAISIRRLLGACAVVIFALGCFNQFSHASRHWGAYWQRNDLKQLADLNACLIDLASENGWSSPGVSYDVITGWLNAGSPTISAFEGSRNLIEFHPMLGNGILGVDRDQAISLLKQSDFVILTNLPKVGIYPFYKHISEYWADLKDWADENMIVARIVPFSTFTATVYVRPGATVSGTAGGWITRHGLSLTAPRAVLERFPVIRVIGSADYTRLPGIPGVRATIDAEGNSQTAKASFRRIDNGYEILIDTSSIDLPSAIQVHIQLDFDTYFMIHQKGHEHDARELVVKAPTLVQLLRKG